MAVDQTGNHCLSGAVHDPVSVQGPVADSGDPSVFKLKAAFLNDLVRPGNNPGVIYHCFHAHSFLVFLSDD